MNNHRTVTVEWKRFQFVVRKNLSDTHQFKPEMHKLAICFWTDGKKEEEGEQNVKDLYQVPLPKMLDINRNIWALPVSNEVGMKVTGMFIFRYKICAVKKININSFNIIQLFPENFPDSFAKQLGVAQQTTHHRAPSHHSLSLEAAFASAQLNVRYASLRSVLRGTYSITFSSDWDNFVHKNKASFFTVAHPLG